jgi:hypothetical protein
MVELMLRKTLGSLRANDRATEESLAKINEGTMVKCKITQPRNIKFHNKFFALLNTVYENTEFKSVENLLDAVKVGAGHYQVEIVGGVEKKIAQSISWGKMDETSFNVFYDRAVDFIISDIIPGVAKGDLEREVFEILGIPTENL